MQRSEVVNTNQVDLGENKYVMKESGDRSQLRKKIMAREKYENKKKRRKE